MNVFERWLRGVEWNIKNSVLLTEKDRVDFAVVEAEFDRWYAGLAQDQRDVVDRQIKITAMARRVCGTTLIKIDCPF